MPSAANVKFDKQINAESNLGESVATGPLRQGITIIEHKIRNLEKRKAKLESYRDLQNAGKELNSDQKTAIVKYDEVVQTLEFARDLFKQFVGIAATTEKETKKVAKKEAQVKAQAELARLREILLVQDALNQMGGESVRDDFLHGRNGAAQLTEVELKLLDDLYPAVTPKHEAGNPTAFTNEVQAAAEHLLAVVDGKPKEVFGGTYSQIKEVLGKIHESGYFDQAQDFGEPAIEEDEQALANEGLEPAGLEPNEPPMAQPIEAEMMNPLPPVESIPPEPQSMAEQIFYPPQPPSQVPLQQLIRPINEVLETGSFFFLQESEIDTPLEQIPSQTFTNQSYVANPPPPIPMPPHFQNMVQPQVPANNNLDNNIVLNATTLTDRSLTNDMNNLMNNTMTQQIGNERNMIKNVITIMNDGINSADDVLKSGINLNSSSRQPVVNNSFFQPVPSNNNGNYNRPRPNHLNHQQRGAVGRTQGNSNRRHN